MKALACSVVVLALVVGRGVVGADGPSAGLTPQQQATPHEPAAVEQQANRQPQVSAEQQASADKLGLPAVITNSIGMKLVLIPAGTFTMGAPPAEQTHMWTSNGPQHEVTISRAYYLGVYEVTQKQYADVLKENPSHFRQGIVLTSNSDTYPVDQVNWADAVAFCQKLSGVPAELSVGRVYRLPTEAEWEYACRAGNKKILTFCFGDSPDALDRYGWYRGNAGSETHPVGEKKPNAWGLFDMHGNVQEWCQDWYGEYSAAKATDPKGPVESSCRVLRGGCWFTEAKHCRSANRNQILPSSRYYTYGFRVALDVAVKVEPPKEAK